MKKKSQSYIVTYYMIPFIKHFRNDNIIELENRGVAARACGEGVDNTGGTGGRPLW